MITERTLRKWRKETLEIISKKERDLSFLSVQMAVVASERILRMTQELIDQHLINK